MKKLIILTVVALLFVSCYDSGRSNENRTETIAADIPYVYTRTVILEKTSTKSYGIQSVQHFMYNGHDYIQFNVNTSYGGHEIIHDPDCSCGNAVK